MALDVFYSLITNNITWVRSLGGHALLCSPYLAKSFAVIPSEARDLLNVAMRYRITLWEIFHFVQDDVIASVRVGWAKDSSDVPTNLFGPLPGLF